MIRLETANPRFSGWRAGVVFRNGAAEVDSLTGEQRLALARMRVRILETDGGDAPNDLGALTVRELRHVAAKRGLTVPPSWRKQDLIDALS